MPTNNEYRYSLFADLNSRLGTKLTNLQTRRHDGGELFIKPYPVSNNDEARTNYAWRMQQTNMGTEVYRIAQLHSLAIPQEKIL